MNLFPILAQAVDPVIDSQWSRTFFGLDQEQRFVLLLVVIGCATGVILGLAGIVYSAIDSAHRRRLEADMKREMIERGMSAEEIAKIIESAPPEDTAQRWIAAWAKKK